jgi:hypothetical protein
MGKGKLLCILSGIIILISTYFLTFGEIIAAYFYGLGFLLNLSDIFALIVTTEDILITIFFILFLLSGFLVLFGVKSRILAIIGSLFAISVGLYFTLIFFGDLPLEITKYAFYFVRLPIVEGILPFHVAIDFSGLGTYTLLGGGILGLLCGIMGRSD